MAHPRWRGEHNTRVFSGGGQWGSSPLARGAPYALGHDADKAMAHPRWRGEHHEGVIRAWVAPGSSPLARGAHRKASEANAVARLIPAGAGSTVLKITNVNAVGAHPRWRGEHLRRIVASRRRGGSSPLARGAPKVFTGVKNTGRLIPAGAGSTSIWGAPASLPRAHPRWRGEHTVQSTPENAKRGSSPLARGAPNWPDARMTQPRLIPAGAGSTHNAENHP